METTESEVPALSFLASPSSPDKDISDKSSSSIETTSFIIGLTTNAEYYRQAPQKVPNFYDILFHCKSVLWFLFLLVLHNYWLSRVNKTWPFTSFFMSFHSLTEGTEPSCGALNFRDRKSLSSFFPSSSVYGPLFSVPSPGSAKSVCGSSQSLQLVLVLHVDVR